MSREPDYAREVHEREVESLDRRLAGIGHQLSDHRTEIERLQILENDLWMKRRDLRRALGELA